MPNLYTPALQPGALADLPQPVLSHDGLLLRPWQERDVAAVVAGYADPAIQRWHCRSMDEAEAREWIARWPGRWNAETGAGWAVTADGSVAGQISLRRIDLEEGLAEVSYWVLPSARGRRIAPRALAALAEWSFGTLKLYRLELSHSMLNTASCRVAEVAGFPAEGTQRGAARHADGWHDMHGHARLATD
ncbi:GNAT family N-acetyltransferase [Actinoplanes sp. NPDC024001]|uniref:GNAT family N-acetyltransferase n=1 Tax=Actinoplanes sp. NPDC024001 TaxID=3154598 RepID=UPI0033E9D008